MSGLTVEQYKFLLAGLAESRVGQLKGQSHVEAWDIRRHLIRVFGFCGWDGEIIDCTLVHENGVEKGGRIGWTVVYRVLYRLIVKDPEGNVIGRYEDAATGDAINLPSIGDAHDFALKTAMSQALKRCAVNLGDQFGLSLYNKGRTGPVVGRSLVVPGEQVDAQDMADVAAQDAPVVPESESYRQPDPAEEPSAEQARPPVPAPTQHGPSPRAAALFAAITEATTAVALKARYDEIRPALDAGEVTEHEARQLDGHVRAAKTRIEQAIQKAQGTTDPAETVPMVIDKQHRRMHVLWRDLGLDGEDNRFNRLEQTSEIVGRLVETSATLTFAEADQVIAWQEAEKRKRRTTQGAAA